MFVGKFSHLGSTRYRHNFEKNVSKTRTLTLLSLYNRAQIDIHQFISLICGRHY